MAEIHNTKKRMPVIVNPDNYSTWLNGNMEEGQQLLSPYPENEMLAYKISTVVNNPSYNDKSIIEKLNKTLW